MRQRLTGTALVAALLIILPLTAAAGQGAEARHASGLHRATWQLVDRSGSRVELPDGGSVALELELLAAAGRRDRHATALSVEGVGLQPHGSYLVLLDGAQVGRLTADAAGRAGLKVATADIGPEWAPAPPERLRFRDLALVQVVEEGSGTAATGALFSHGGTPAEGADAPPVYADWTALCGGGEVSGGVGVYRDDVLQVVDVVAFGLEPGTTYRLVIDDMDAAAVTADVDGSLWVELSTDPESNGSLPLPDELQPVDAIDVVELRVGDTTVLAGSFSQPCQPQPPQPVQWGGFDLCPVEAEPGAVPPYGTFAWTVWGSGTEEAMVAAEGLEPGRTVTIVFDTTAVGSATVDEWGFLAVVFSTDPRDGELPLPGSVLPLSGVGGVSVMDGSDVLLDGSPGQTCEGWEPPVPVSWGMTELCPLGAGSDAFGEVGWEQYENGAEDFWMVAVGLPPGMEYTVTVDGMAAASVTADESGSVYLDLTSDPAMGGEPLPDALRPVSGIDVVSLESSAGAVLQGSFSDPCDGGWEPPMPVATGDTPLCPTDDDAAAGEAFWAVFQDPDAQLFDVAAQGLTPGGSYELVVDGVSLGTYGADRWGGLWVDLCSDPGLPGCQDALPPTFPDVREIDRVELLAASGTAVLAGSFVTPCTSGPGDTSFDDTGLCDASGAVLGAAAWWQILGGDGSVIEEGIEVDYMPMSAAPTDGGPFRVVIDGVDAGQMQGVDGWYYTLALTSEDGLPPVLSPVSSIDHVQVLDASGVVVVEGSFSEPCGDPLVLAESMERAQRGAVPSDGIPLHLRQHGPRSAAGRPTLHRP